LFFVLLGTKGMATITTLTENEMAEMERLVNLSQEELEAMSEPERRQWFTKTKAYCVQKIVAGYEPHQREIAGQLTAEVANKLRYEDVKQCTYTTL
jgi:hypothetical protein